MVALLWNVWVVRYYGFLELSIYLYYIIKAKMIKVWLAICILVTYSMTVRSCKANTKNN